MRSSPGAERDHLFLTQRRLDLLREAFDPALALHPALGSKGDGQTIDPLKRVLRRGEVITQAAEVLVRGCHLLDFKRMRRKAPRGC